MKRRSFLKNLSASSAGTFLLNGIPVSAMASGNFLSNLAAQSQNDKVLILIQLHGGNDGLNAVIPINQYSQYYNLRPNLAIPKSGSRKLKNLDGSLPDDKQVGIHPDMESFQDLYNQGKAALVQGVAYKNINGSHFRSRDIWFMGSDFDEHLGSGWMGRYLDFEFPNYPENYPNENMKDPLGIEIGTGVSLAFHRANGIPMAVSAQNPRQFFDLITGVGIIPPDSVANTFYGDELQWIIDIEKKSNEYAGRLKTLYEKGTNSAEAKYPEVYPFSAPERFLHNSLANQLKTIARLISGGCKTKIYLARIGGFDTHASQVTNYDPTMGAHSALLYHLFGAVRAFQDDLKGLGLEDRVMTATFSEFGRRAKSNGSYGTDHGTSAPMFVFGKDVIPGVVGNNPDLSDLDGGNLKNQFDYRQVFTTLLQDWMEASDEAMQHVQFDDYLNQKLPLVGKLTHSKEAFFHNQFQLGNCYPNPARSQTTVPFFINNPETVTINLYDQKGRTIKSFNTKISTSGQNEIKIELKDITPGNYVYELKTSRFRDSGKLIVR